MPANIHRPGHSLRILKSTEKLILDSDLFLQGNWRMSHYFAQEMFAQVLVSPTLPPPYDQLKVAIVSDTVEKMELELHVKIQRFDSLTKNYHKIQPILIDPLEVVETEFLMEEFLINGNCLEMPSNMTNFNLCFITLWYYIFYSKAC